MQAIAKGLLLGKRQCSKIMHMHNGVKVLRPEIFKHFNVMDLYYPLRFTQTSKSDR